MKLYQTIDGTLIGFYQESGGEVQAIMYRDVYETVRECEIKEVEESYREWIDGIYLPSHTEMESREYFIPEHTEYQLVVVEDHWEYKTWTEEAHWGTREYWLGPHTEIRYRQVDGHYEIKPHWFEEYSITKYRTVQGFWEAYERDIPPRGVTEQTEPPYTWYRWIEQHVESYEEVIPAGYKDTRVWIDTYQEPYEEEIPGCWQERRIWFPKVTRTTKKWVPMHEELQLVTIPDSYETRVEEIIYPDKWTQARWERKTRLVEKEVCTVKEVWVGYEPVYSYVHPSQVTTFEVNKLVRAPADRPDLEDSVILTNTLTGEVLTTTATYLGLATRIDENEYVVP